VARNLQGARLTIVGTYRDVEVDRTHALSGVLADLRRVQGFQRVPLRGLTVDEVQRMISNIRGQEVSWGRAEMYYRQTEGNPLFIQELLRYLVEEGLVVREGGRYALADPSQPEAGVPEGLRDVIGKRLSRLSPECNRLLAIAAVIGRDFNLETLRAVTAVEEEAMLSSLEEAVRVGVLEERSQPGRVLYRFAHAFFRQTLYEEMIAPRRLRLHQEIARALEAQYGNRREDHAAELAEHFAQSTDKADLAKAVEYGELAAQRAMSVFDYGEAARLLERALDVQEVLDPEDKAKRCDLLLALGEALMPAGEPVRVADEIAEEALALGQVHGDRERCSRACQLALVAHTYEGPAMGANVGFQRWVERAAEHALPGTTDQVYTDLAVAWVLLEGKGEPEAAWRAGVKALELARQLNEPDAFFRAAHFLISPSRTRLHAEERLQLAEEIAARDRTGVSVRTMFIMFTGLNLLFLDYGQLSRVEELRRERRELAERTRLNVGSDLQDDVPPLIVGRLEETVGANNASRALLHLGKAQEVPQLRSGVRLVGQRPTATANDVGALLRRWGWRVLCLAHLAREDEARSELRQLLEWDAATKEDGGRLLIATLAQMLEAAVLTQDSEVAAVLVERVRPLSHLTISYNAFTSMSRQLGAAAALLGNPEEARAYYDRALEVCAKIRFRPEIALTRLQLAELLLAESAKPNPIDLRTSPSQPNNDVGARSPRPGGVGEGASEGEETSPLRGVALAAALRAEALDHLDFAISEFREMKMQPSLERALRHRGLLRA
ncbi:MAG TPA: hypothetical protein VI789_07785, partial [Dehalococcoidia bacterium]|nr:hypothetical protein [Dehalococcoidia bacterium]